MSSLRSVAAATIASVLLLPLMAMPIGCSREKPSSDRMGQLEMRSPAGESTKVHTADPAALTSFKREYTSARRASRPVFEKYIPVLGAAAILDFLEETYPGCHSRAHDLGRVLFATAGDLGAALRECDTRCTSGCMHGVLAEAFGSSAAGVITAKANIFCTEGEMARLHKPGNCAHGLGHALMFVMGGDLRRSVDACLGFTLEAMQYYCATGVYMEHLVTGRDSARPTSSVHRPCDEETLFPTACYRYKGTDLLREFGDHRRGAVECMRLDAPQRRGCFHGLGHAFIDSVFRDPQKLALVCSQGARDDQVVCIEGVTERLAEYGEGRAKAACGSLNGEMRVVCDQSARRKMYALDKPTFALYYDREAVARRREALTATADNTKDDFHHRE